MNEFQRHIMIWMGDRILGLVSMVARKADRPDLFITEVDYCPL